jgi:hypothetical protein
MQNVIQDLCKSGGLVPSIVGSDQGWYFIRRIETSQGHCSVYEVRDNWRPKPGWVTGDTGEDFFTKAAVLKIKPEPVEKKGRKKRAKKK